MKKQQRKEEKNGGSNDVKGEAKSDSEDGAVTFLPFG